MARGSHVIMMASDLETDPDLVPEMIRESKARPGTVITATRWRSGDSFQGYGPAKVIGNWIFQQFFRVLYWSRLSDFTFGYRLFPTSLVKAINWKELRHPFLFETILKPLRLGIPVKEISTSWSARDEGKSQNVFSSYFKYFWVGIRCRMLTRAHILEPRSGARQRLMPVGTQGAWRAD